MNEKKPVIVVEGKTDIDKLSKLVDAIIVSTNGSEVSRETLEYIKTLSKDRKVIILTDPDYPGLRIRDIISNFIPGAYNAYVDRKKASNGKKLGVAESPDEEILRALEKVHYVDINEVVHYYTMEEMLELGLTGKDYSSRLREKVYNHFDLGYGNAKTLAKRLSLSNISKDELFNFIKENYDENC